MIQPVREAAVRGTSPTVREGSFLGTQYEPSLTVGLVPLFLGPLFRPQMWKKNHIPDRTLIGQQHH